MFTGLISDVGEIVERDGDDDRDADGAAEAGVSFGIRTDLGVEDFEIGESIAVDGACLTVTETEGDLFRVDAAPETLRKTTLGDLQVSDGVHLERALRAGDRLGGHFVQGHVDGVGELLDRRDDGEAWELVFRAPEQVATYLIEKGSVTVDGVSLTAYDIRKDGFTVTIVPHTARETKLTGYRPGQRVNLEADMLGKYVEKLFDGEARRPQRPPTSGRH